MADVNNDGKADIFVTDMLPESDERLKNTNFENYDLFLRKINLDFFNQYMQNTLQINNGITNLWKLIMLVLLKQIELGRLFDMDNDGYKDICLQRNLP
jgi:hypothetical protein